MLSRDLVEGITRLLYWVGLPAAVFHAMIKANLTGAGVGPLLFALMGVTVISAAWSWWLAPRLGINTADRGTFVQASFRGNLSFIALPLLLTVPGVVLGPAMLAFAPMVIIYNALAVLVLAISRGGDLQQAWRTTIIEIMRNPIMIAASGGLLYNLWIGDLPLAAERSLGALAQMALPLALLCIGATLTGVPIKGRRRSAMWAAAHKVILCPALGFLLGRAMGLDDGNMLILLICLAVPTASISYTMAKRMGGDEVLAASAVVYSALASMVSLSVVIAIFAL
jgi:predicted permease